MKNKAAYILGIVTLVLSMSSCNSDNGKADGYGNFEATEITISAENNGKLMQFNVKEGDLLEKGTFIGYIDTIPLSLKREQLISSKAVVSSQSKSVLSQISVLNAKLKTAQGKTQRCLIVEGAERCGVKLDPLCCVGRPGSAVCSPRSSASIRTTLFS